MCLFVPEANAKTTGLAGLALYHCQFRPNAFVPWAASARDQAEIGYTQARVFAQSMPKAKRPRCYDGYRRIQFANGSRIQVFAAGAEHADGVVPTLPIIDELHRHKDMSLYRTWSGKLDKRDGQLLTISTAGEPGSDFEVMREKIRAEASEVAGEGAFRRYIKDELICVHEWAVRDDAIDDIDAVKAANPSPRITEEMLLRKRSSPTMTDAHWRRFTCGLATMDEGKEPYIQLGDWDACADDDSEIPAEAVVCLGADGSRTWDTTVVAWASSEEGIVTVDARVFSVRPEIDCHVLHEGGKIDFDDVEAFILDRFDFYAVSEVAYDPRYLERSMEIVDVRLPEVAVFPVEPTSKHMRDALQTMFNLVAEGKLRHRGDPIHRQHIANSGAERGFASELRRIRKIDSRLPIDAVPAMALAIWRAEKEQSSVYDERELVLA